VKSLSEIVGLNLNSRHRQPLLLATALAVLSCGSVQATVVQGTMIGIFSNPVLMGLVQNDPSLGLQTQVDNTNTAVWAINNSTDPTLAGNPPVQATGSALTWGVLTGSSGPTTFSTVEFFGAQIPANPGGNPFQIGEITFINGTSDIPSIIFGATLSFYDNSVSQANFLGSDHVVITTTQNIGTQAQDADYLSICGNNSSICNMSIEAYEATEGGTGLTVNLIGTIVGDPMLALTNVTLAPNQSTGGFIGNDPPVANQPEPGTILLVPVALALLVAKVRRRTFANR
jgi:hypothetical protein